MFLDHNLDIKVLRENFVGKFLLEHLWLGNVFTTQESCIQETLITGHPFNLLWLKLP